MVRKRMIFYGRVQGVGFRYRAYQEACKQGLTGWVRNDWDGTVTMEAQGEEQAINGVVEALQRGRYISISHIEVRDLPLEPSERGFRVEGY